MADLETLIIEARREYSSSRWLSAIDKYSEALAISPFILSLHIERHFCFTHLNLYKEAMNDLSQIIQKTSFLQEVRTDLEPLFEIRADAFYYSAEQFLRKSKWEQSLGAYKECTCILELLPKTNTNRNMKKAQAYFKEGLLLRDKRKNTAQAISAFTRAISLSEEESAFRKKEGHIFENHRTQCYFARAVCYETLEDYSSAMRDYLHLGDFSGNFYIGRMFYFAAKLEDAERHLETCMEIPRIRDKTKISAAYLLLQTRLGLQAHINN